MLASLLRRFRKNTPVAASPVLDVARLSEAVAMQRRGEWEDALTAYSELLAIDPANLQVRHLMASALAGAKRSAEAIAEYRKLAAQGYAPAELRIALAGLLNATGAYSEAAVEAAAASAALGAEDTGGSAGKKRLADLARDEGHKAAIMATPYPALRKFRRAGTGEPATGTVNIVYFHVAAARSPHATCEGVDYPELIALSAATARARMPGARIVLLTDEHTQFPGVEADRLIRSPANADEVVYERTRMLRAYLTSDAFDADSIMVDSDTVFHGDARAAFATEFDFAYTVRRGFELMPFNVGVVFARHASRAALLPYFDACLACYEFLGNLAAVRERYPEGIRRWWGDQLVPAAMVGWVHVARDILESGMDLAEIDGTRIGFLASNIYNFDAVATDVAPEAAFAGKLILHFKGVRKEAMRHYCASLNSAVGKTAEMNVAADEAWHAGLASWDAGNLEAARAKLEHAIALSSRNAIWYNELGLLCMAIGDYPAAGAAYRAALAIDPGLAEAHCNLGIVLEQAGGPEQGNGSTALAHFLRAAELKPGLVSAQYNCGLLLWKSGKAEESLEYFDRALALDSGQSDTWRNRAYALQEVRRFDESAMSFDRALAIRPDYHEVRLSLAFLQLLRGDFRAGWANYHARHGTAESPLRDYTYPDWDGGPLAGLNLLVYAEQGLGDEILFASCIPDLIGKARHVVIECEPRLEKLFARSFPQATVRGVRRNASAAWLTAVPALDLKIAAGSVPGFLRNAAADFPVREKYLEADAGRIAWWKQRLDALGPGPKIGLAWRGGLPQTRTGKRSLPLAGLLPVLQLPGVQFVSLQYDATPEELGALQSAHGLEVHHWPDAHADYDETAALAMALDQVLTVCCSVVHLAGALGKTALVLTPYVPEWRYLAEGDNIPWYRSVRLLRQIRAGDWEGVVMRARGAIAAQSGIGIAANAAAQRKLLEQRVEAAPEDAEAHRQLAELALVAGDFETAIDSFALATHYRPADVAAMIGHSRALRAIGNAAEAERVCREAIALAPTSLAAQLEFASTLKARDRNHEAIAAYRAALTAHPDSPELLCNLGLALHASAAYAEAEPMLRRALAARPDFAEAHHNLGLVLREEGDIEGAIGEFNAALATLPLAATRSALAHALRDAGRFDAALEEYDAVLAALPDYGDAVLNRAHALLMRGDYARGWDAYEKRFAAGDVALRPFVLPRWEGGAAAGRGILVFGEQGLGDEIMFASCIPDLIQQEGSCVIECNSRLASLFARSFGMPVHGGAKQDDSAWLKAFPQLGWQVPIGSLPRIFRRDTAAFARRTSPYLRADPERTAVWRERFGTLGEGSKIGIAWRGGNAKTRGGLRSIELEALAPLLSVPGSQFVSLQHGAVDGEIAALLRERGLRVASWPDTGADLDELAAMIAALDRVVTIDNTVAHLAGALGIPVWILLARGAEWRYGVDQARMPWYPQARLFRQHASAPGWGATVSAAATALGAEAGAAESRR